MRINSPMMETTTFTGLRNRCLMGTRASQIPGKPSTRKNIRLMNSITPKTGEYVNVGIGAH
jgi:hypothetical protein